MRKIRKARSRKCNGNFKRKLNVLVWYRTAISFMKGYDWKDTLLFSDYTGIAGKFKCLAAGDSIERLIKLEVDARTGVLKPIHEHDFPLAPGAVIKIQYEHKS